MIAGTMTYITVEGIDGCGKTTVTTRLIAELEEMGLRVGKYSMLPEGPLRDLVLWDKSLTTIQRTTLYKVAAETTRTRMVKESDMYDVAIVDRGIESFISYQGYGEEQLEEIFLLLKIFPEFPKPDRTLYLRITPTLSKERTKIRDIDLDYFEKKSSAFFDRVFYGYEECVRKDLENSKRRNCRPRFKVVDGALDKDTVYAAVLADVLDLLKNQGKIPA